MNITFETHWDLSTGKTLPLFVHIHCYHPGLPAKLSGPPEDCYPEEPDEVDYDIYLDEDCTKELPIEHAAWRVMRIQREALDVARNHWEAEHDDAPDLY